MPELPPLERAAKAAYEKYHSDPETAVVNYFWADIYFPDEKERWMATTRAALETLVGPTPEMMSAAFHAVLESDNDDESLDFWQAMLGKVLEG